MAAPPRQPPELVGDAIAEILLRVPPKEPAHLVRASLVCKPWRRVLTDPAFLRRYRRFHGAPPLLGFFNNIHSAKHVPRFVPTTATASPFSSSAAFDCRPLDCRHGRVLFEQTDDTDEFLVWYPITGARAQHPVLVRRGAMRDRRLRPFQLPRRRSLLCCLCGLQGGLLCCLKLMRGALLFT
jgi:hypothetical protein